MGDSDASLVARTRAGDRAAFDELVRKHQRMVYRLAYRLLGNPEDAGDAMQETFLRAYEHLPRFRADGNFRNWLLTIATNHCMSYRRYRRRRMMEPLDESVIGEPPDWAPQVPGNPSRLAEGKDELRRLQAAIEALPPRQRLAITLFSLEDQSIAGVAQIMRCSQGTVKATIHRARENLRRALEAQEATSRKRTPSPRFRRG
ncbi:MAG: RNA polymerase sigma factor, partial [Candidatus Zipacnadales bacterium]